MCSYEPVYEQLYKRFKDNFNEMIMITLKRLIKCSKKNLIFA